MGEPPVGAARSAKGWAGRPGSPNFRYVPSAKVGMRRQSRNGRALRKKEDEAGLEARQIGRIRVFEQHSLVELPEDLPARIVKHLSKVRVAGQMLRIHPTEAMPPRGPRASASEPVARAERPARPDASRPAASPRPAARIKTCGLRSLMAASPKASSGTSL